MVAGVYGSFMDMMVVAAVVKVVRNRCKVRGAGMVSGQVKSSCLMHSSKYRCMHFSASLLHLHPHYNKCD